MTKMVGIMTRQSEKHGKAGQDDSGNGRNQSFQKLRKMNKVIEEDKEEHQESLQLNQDYYSLMFYAFYIDDDELASRKVPQEADKNILMTTVKKSKDNTGSKSAHQQRSP